MMHFKHNAYKNRSIISNDFYMYYIGNYASTIYHIDEI